MAVPTVREERTEWRDLEFSKRHRKWGWDCPALDIDFLMIEYDYGIPIALVEYKNEYAITQHSSHPSYKALITLGNLADLPVFACRYSNDLLWYKAVALNDKAHEWLPERKTMTEREWVTLLYDLRGRSFPENLFDGDNIITGT